MTRSISSSVRMRCLPNGGMADIGLKAVASYSRARRSSRLGNRCLTFISGGPMLPGDSPSAKAWQAMQLPTPLFPLRVKAISLPGGYALSVSDGEWRAGHG